MVALAYDGLCTFEFGVAVEIFGLGRPEMGEAWYRFRVAAIEPGPLRAAGGIRVESDGGLRLIERAGTIIVPGWRGADAPVPERLLAALRRAHKRGARLVSFCSGVFVLAATGLLDGKRATTHWRYAERLARAYPQISRGAGRALHRRGQPAHGRRERGGHRPEPPSHPPRLGRGGRQQRGAAPRRASRIATAARRSSSRRRCPRRGKGGGSGLCSSACAPSRRRETTIAALAQTAGMSRRTFLRRFKANTGTTPGAWLATARIARARELLKSSTAAIEEVAAAAGFGSAATLRHHFRKHVKVSPAAYRRRFAMEI